MAYTPGPWTEHGAGDCECGMIFGPDGNVLVAIVQGEIHLNDTEGPDCVPTKAFQQGNARLISAAPDLLLAVKCLCEEMADYMAINKLGDPNEKHNYRLGMAAIAKAERT